MNDTIRIFVGADRSAQLPCLVLEHSIKRHTQRDVRVEPIDNGLVPTASDPRNSPYTNFSFARFHIPAICEYSGKAIYMDSDMLVFHDIAEVWETPFDGGKVLIERGSFEKNEMGKQAAIMQLDCSRLPWDAAACVASLGRDYTYNELMSLKPLLNDSEIRQRIPNGWNELDRYEPQQTRNLHFTEIRTQPWVYAGHPCGGLWIDEVTRMLQGGVLTEDILHTEIDLGYLRPSILVELGLEKASARADDGASLRRYDQARGFAPHRQLLARFAERKLAIAHYKRNLAVKSRPWLAPFYDVDLWFKRRRYSQDIARAA